MSVADAAYWYYEYIEPPPPTPDAGVEISVEDARAWIAQQNFRNGVMGLQEAVGLATDGVLGPQTVAAAGVLRARNGKLSEHFHLDEFRCSHCRRARVNKALVDALEAVRARVGPMGKDSSYRCEDHALSISNPRSMHRLGCAWDPAPDLTRGQIAGCGFSGIGVSAADRNRVTHIDVRHASNDNFTGSTPANPSVFLDN
jgi:hypothetical protein